MKSETEAWTGTKDQVPRCISVLFQDNRVDRESETVTKRQTGIGTKRHTETGAGTEIGVHGSHCGLSAVFQECRVVGAARRLECRIYAVICFAVAAPSRRVCPGRVVR